jgi:hypothetical protein
VQAEQPKPGVRYKPARIELSPDGSGGVSRKPSDALLNWHRLYETIPSIVVTVAGTELNPTHVIAIHAMWTAEDGNQRITESKAFAVTNLFLISYDRPELIISTFNEIVDDLAAMRCLEVTEGVIWLLESVDGL